MPIREQYYHFDIDGSTKRFNLKDLKEYIENDHFFDQCPGDVVDAEIEELSGRVVFTCHSKCGKIRDEIIEAKSIEDYGEYSDYCQGAYDCENASYKPGMGKAYDVGFGDKYQLQEIASNESLPII